MPSGRFRGERQDRKSEFTLRFLSSHASFSAAQLSFTRCRPRLLRLQEKVNSPPQGGRHENKGPFCCLPLHGPYRIGADTPAIRPCVPRTKQESRCASTRDAFGSPIHHICSQSVRSEPATTTRELRTAAPQL